MKASFNGVLQLSVLDGWWAEAYDGTNGWAIPGDEDPDPAVMDARDADALLRRCSSTRSSRVFYDRDDDGVPHRWCERMKASIATNAPRFSATRMLDDYVSRIYPRNGASPAAASGVRSNGRRGRFRADNGPGSGTRLWHSRCRSGMSGRRAAQGRSRCTSPNSCQR